MPNSRQQPTEQALENYLAGDSQLSRLYADHSPLQTPHALDARVAAAARSNPKVSKPRVKTTRRLRRWGQYLVAFGVLLLGLALAFDLLKDQAIIPADQQGSTATPQPAAPVPDQAARNTLNPSDTTEAIAPESDTSPREEPESKPEPKPERTTGTSDTPPKQQPADKPAPVADTAQPSTAAEKAAPKPPVLAPTTTPSPAAAPKPEPTKPEAPEQESAPVTPTKPAPAPVPVAPEPAPEPATPSEPAQIPPPQAQTQTPSEPEYRETQKTWIRYIVFLQDTEQHEQAISELNMFRKRYPQASLPPELQDLTAPRHN